MMQRRRQFLKSRRSIRRQLLFPYDPTRSPTSVMSCLEEAQQIFCYRATFSLLRARANMNSCPVLLQDFTPRERKFRLSMRKVTMEENGKVWIVSIKYLFPLVQILFTKKDWLFFVMHLMQNEKLILRASKQPTRI